MTRRNVHNVSRARSISRRRVLAGALAASTGATLLAACSGNDASESAGSTATSSSAPTTADQPQRGGVLRSAATFDVSTFDPIAAKGAADQLLAGYAHSRLLKFKPGVGSLADGTLEADAAISWEQPDPTTLVLQLRDGMKLDQRPPTSGRALTSEDVVLSWDKFASVAVYRTDLANSASKEAPVLSFTASDPKTIEIKTAFPDAQLLPAMNFWGGLWILPKESFIGGYDAAMEMRGTGPWVLENYQPSVAFRFRKNPNYYDAAQYPLMDGVELPIILDAGQAQAQFKAGNVYLGGGGGSRPGAGISASDILGLHTEVKDSRIDLDAPFIWGSTISLSYRDGSPFKDRRVRQALSMLLDRDAFIEVFGDLKRFQAAGLKMKAYWTTPLSGGWGPYWLDPKDAKFGSNAKYLQYNVGEAKKLLAAAGYPDGFETPFTYVAGPRYGHDWGQRGEALMAMLGQGGIRCKANPVDYNSVWIPQFLRNQGDIEGVAMYGNGGRGDVGQWLQVFFSSYGPNNQVGTNFPELDALIGRQRSELDPNKRIGIVHDIQRHFAEQMPAVPQGGSTELPTLNRKGLHGPDTYSMWQAGVDGAELDVKYWLDDSLRN